MESEQSTLFTYVFISIKITLSIAIFSCAFFKFSQSKKQEVLHLLEPKTKRYFDTFFRCISKKVFWKGSHYDTIQKKISSLGISIH